MSRHERLTDLHRRLLAAFACAVALSCLQNPAFGDALVVTRAMTASTIAQIYVENREVRVEFEIGAADLKVFANLLPDDLYTKLIGTTRPLEERLPILLTEECEAVIPACGILSLEGLTSTSIRIGNCGALGSVVLGQTFTPLSDAKPRAPSFRFYLGGILPDSRFACAGSL